MMESKYKELLEYALDTDNKLEIRSNGWGLITGPRWSQGLWISSAIIRTWNLEGWL